jgi:hypothetical protein
MAEKKVKKEAEVKEKLPLTYKGRLLAKKDNVIYYGNPEDKYLVMLNITDTGEKDGILTTAGVTVSLQTNSGGLKEKVIKKVERDGIYKALDIAEYWLNDALNGE